MFTDPQLIAGIGALAGLVGTIVAIAKAHAAWRKWKNGWKHRIGNFLDDWEGRPERPGKDREPGVMERLKVLEDTQAAQGSTLAAQDGILETIRHEVEFNNGSSVKDAVVRTEKGQKELAERLDAHLGPAVTVNVHPQENT